MKNLIFAAIAVAMLTVAGNAFAADISQDMLSEMGLGDMQTMSDSQGMDVRGMGFYHHSPATATVSGFVSVHVPGVYIYETKYASDHGRSAFAQGGFTVEIVSSYGYLKVSEVGFAFSGGGRR